MQVRHSKMGDTAGYSFQRLSFIPLGISFSIHVHVHVVTKGDIFGEAVSKEWNNSIIENHHRHLWF